MKATLLISLVALTTFSQSAWAQTSFRWGITAGLNNSVLHHTYLPPNNRVTSLWGYNAGLSFSHDLTKTLSLAYDLNFTRQGEISTSTSPLGLGSYQIIILADYVSLPLMLCYRPGGGRLWIGAGPQLGFLLRGKVYDPQEGKADAMYWDLQQANRFDMGLTAGLGYQISRHLLLTSRYYLSLRPVFSPGANVRSEDIQKIYNRSGSLNLVYYF
ncbi:porin family protein [Spirosoma pollinicola]|nr:porin family protein [Spirosoma pollinicola]